MKVYFIKIRECEYNQYDGFVVVAENKGNVNKWLKNKYPDKMHGKVNYSKGYIVTELDASKYKKTTKILSSYNAG